MLKGGAAFIGCVVALSVAAGSAFATTDRLDYADQANPICKSANKQIVDLYAATETEVDRLYDIHAKNRKQARRLRRQTEQLEEQLPFQVLALYQASLDQLKLLAAPAGYENTVASWLGNRQQIATLYQQSILIERQLENPFGGPPHERHSRKAFRRRAKRLERLFRQSDQIDEALLTASEVDLELGTRMGAAYCVTGATGDLPSSVAVHED